MGAASRRKGANGERDFRDMLRRFGFDARRDGRLDDDLAHNVDDYHFEVKRRETLAIPAWIRQAIADAGRRKWVVAFRRNREPWRAVIDAEELLRLLVIEKAAKKVRADVERDPWHVPDSIYGELDDALGL